MTESYQVETGDVAISNALLEIAITNGWKFDFEPKQVRPYLLFYSGKRDIRWNQCAYPEHTTVIIPEFIALLKKGPQQIIKIGDNVVEFKDDGITVGCQFVDTATVDAIHKQLHAPKEE